jgi:hypothetical protein
MGIFFRGFGNFLTASIWKGHFPVGAINIKIDLSLDCGIFCLRCQLADGGLCVQLRYRHLEAALADVMEIRPKDMSAFRARLRHLRNIGVPQLPNPGSGQPIEYSRHQALEMLIALQLEIIGQSPRQTALRAGTIVRQLPYGQHAGKDCFALVSQTKPWVTLLFGPEQFCEAMNSLGDEAFLGINVSACVRKLELALDRAFAAT